MEDDRVSLLEQQLAQAKLIAEEADKKYEEVGYVPARNERFFLSFDKPFGSESMIVSTSQGQNSLQFLTIIVASLQNERCYSQEYTIELTTLEKSIFSFLKKLYTRVLLFYIYFYHIYFPICNFSGESLLYDARGCTRLFNEAFAANVFASGVKFKMKFLRSGRILLEGRGNEIARIILEIDPSSSKPIVGPLPQVHRFQEHRQVAERRNGSSHGVSTIFVCNS